MNNPQKNNDPHSPGARYLILLTFVSGMTIMGLEMCSGRLMAPFFGTSVMIWTVIIGSTMIALTAGYYLGGLLAEKKPRVEFLAAILFFGAIFVIFLPYVAQPVMEIALGRFSVASGNSPNALVIALSLCALLISAPAVILGMTSPFIIHIAAMDSSAVGRIAGKVFAFSTLGSILGTLMPALVFLPWYWYAPVIPLFWRTAALHGYMAFKKVRILLSSSRCRDSCSGSVPGGERIEGAAETAACPSAGNAVSACQHIQNTDPFRERRCTGDCPCHGCRNRYAIHVD